jgi:hypothetical protein
MIEPVFPLAPKITYVTSVTTATLPLRLFIFVSPFLRYAVPTISLAGSTDFPNYIGEGYSTESILETVLRLF